ncbi:hypothetical protein [Candidatus Solirubrobacter pratensis]|uniref:hypothetical protein n=1 Tax=Candidatus Solirubrobacter pratensis TaxID=1298857 RepID=UPI000487FAF4|nr:hypothetical protein [Candidatus Solirubrobacter pratensis]
MIARVALWCLAVSSALTGLPAAFAPRSFYDGWPLGRGWVKLLPPYNEHLVTDVGGFYLAFALLFAWAALTPSRELVLPLCGVWSVAAVIHFVYHVTHLGGFGTGDAIAQTAALALVLALPLIAAAAVPRHPAPRAAPPR